MRTQTGLKESKLCKCFHFPAPYGSVNLYPQTWVFCFVWCVCLFVCLYFCFKLELLRAPWFPLYQWGTEKGRLVTCHKLVPHVVAMFTHARVRACVHAHAHHTRTHTHTHAYNYVFTHTMGIPQLPNAIDENTFFVVVQANWKWIVLSFIWMCLLPKSFF